jgi:outer membrane protein
LEAVWFIYMSFGFSLRWAGLSAVFLASGLALAQDQALTLDEALARARVNNGNVQAAFYQVQAARARVGQARSAFLPTVTPALRWSDRRIDGAGFADQQRTGTQIDLTANWRALDLGERDLTVRATTRQFRAEELTALTTLRNVLFAVNQQYFEALRAQELERVADAQVERARTLLEQTTAQVDVGEAPRKDILQARADFLNAQVQQLAARNRTAAAESQLKATIGWPSAEELPDLVALREPGEFPELEPLVALMDEGMRQRPDLEAQRRRIEAQTFGVRRTRLEAGPQLGVDLSYQRGFTPDVFQQRGLSLVVSFPLFDGFRTREAVREAEAGLDASESGLVQTEREARSEIETAYITLVQNAQRVRAAELALEAARLNYQAAAEAQRLGALGTDVVTVLTAQVSLVTAETNYIEAIYDHYIAEARLRLVTGRPVAGEDL